MALRYEHVDETLVLRSNTRVAIRIVRGSPDQLRTCSDWQWATP